MASKRKERKPTPLKSDDVPEFITEYAVAQERNPTAAGLGNSADPADSTHLVDDQILAALVAVDLPNWSAFDEIVRGLIRGRKPDLSEIEIDKALARAKVAVDGSRPGAGRIDDDAFLSALASRYVAECIRHQGEVLEASERRIILELIADEHLGRVYREERQDAVYRRIRRKFRADKNRLLAMATAASHPAQRERWRQVQEIIDRMKALGLAK